MRKEWVLWKKLKQDTGMGWKTIAATASGWCCERVHHNSFRKLVAKKESGKQGVLPFQAQRPCLPDEQEEIFGSAVATGNFSMTSADIPQSNDPVLRLTGDDIENLEIEYQGSLQQLLGMGIVDEEAA